MQPAWITAEAVDTETVARLSHLLAPLMVEMKVCDSACLSGLALEAAEVFQLHHFSFDELYWDARDYPAAVRCFAHLLMEVLRDEPDWINRRYVTGLERLSGFLRRRRVEL